MEGVNALSIDKVCRSCLGEKADMQSLYTRYEGPLKLNVSNYSRMLMASASIIVCEGDGLPSFICGHCRAILVQAYSFRTMCEQADAKLRAYTGLLAPSKNNFTQTEGSECFQMYNCGQCQKKFKGLIALQRHSRRHLRAECVGCESCGNIYSDKETLKKHLIDVHHIEMVGNETKIEVWGNNLEEKVAKEMDMKKEPQQRIKVKEEPEDVYHEEDDIQSDLMISPVKEEYYSDETNTPIEFDKKRTSKKRNKRNPGKTSSLLESHPCSYCPRMFSTKGHLEAHEAKHVARAQRYTCTTCDKTFTRSTHLKRHQLDHHSEEAGPVDKLSCPHCSKIFDNSDTLDKHIQIKHQNVENIKNPKVAFCNLCDRGFTTQRYLEIHMRNHRSIGKGDGKEEVPGFPCKSCDHISKNKIEARTHLQWHRQAERPFLCSECGQGFTRDAYLTVHMRRHRGEKPFSCGYCGKGFPRRSDLDIHERYHTEDKRHTCAICGKAFHRQYNLKVHLRVHTGERPYACTYCSKAFTQPNDLKAHVRRHTGERFTCELCSAQFLHGYHLTQHRRAVHAVDKPSHIRRLSKFPSAGPPNPSSQAPPAPTRGRARQAHIQLAAHMASILAAQQPQPSTVPPAPISLTQPPTS